MAELTIAIRDIIHDYDPSLSPMRLDFTARCSLAVQNTIFGPYSLARLNPNYKDMFCVGFATKFWEEEIGNGLTLASFQDGVNGTLYRNAEYINSIFDLLNKQLLSNYTTTVNTSNNETDWKQQQVTVTLEDASAITTYNTNQNTTQHSTTNTTNEDNSLTNSQGDGAVTTTLNTDSTTHNTGTENTHLDSNSTQDNTGTVTTAQESDTDTTNKGGTRTNTGENTQFNDGLTWDEVTTRRPDNLAQRTTGSVTHFNSTYPQTQVNNPLDAGFLSSSSRQDYGNNGVTVTQSGSETTSTRHTPLIGQNTQTTTRNPDLNVSTSIAVGPTGSPIDGSTTDTHVDGETVRTDATQQTVHTISDNDVTRDLSTVTENRGDTVVTDQRGNTTTSESQTTGQSSTDNISNSSKTGSDTTTNNVSRNLTGNNEYNTVSQGNQNGATQTVMPLDVFYRSAPLIERVWALFKEDFIGIYNTGN